MSTPYYRVLLPSKRLWQQYRYHIPTFKQSVLDYMKRYPNYEVLQVNKGYAICKRKDKMI